MEQLFVAINSKLGSALGQYGKFEFYPNRKAKAVDCLLA